jgi:hypothetical protein
MSALSSLFILLGLSCLATWSVLLFYLVRDAQIIKKEGSTRRIPLWLSLVLSPVFAFVMTLFFYGLLPFLFLEMLIRRFNRHGEAREGTSSN